MSVVNERVRPPRPAPSLLILGAAVALLCVALVTWSKWWPYVFRTMDIAATGAVGDPILAGAAGGAAGTHPIAAGWDFAVTYTLAVWKALLTGLVIAAAIDALLPRAWLLRLMGDGRRPLRSTLTGALLGLPTMMCTCCAVPVTAAMRRRGVPAAAAFGFWTANPMLNPAVLVFCLLVLPWEWTAVRFAAGVAMVLCVAAVFARSRESVPEPDGTARGAALPATPAGEPGPASAADALRRFARTFTRMALILIPEYLGIMFLIGVAQTWVSPADWGAWAAGAVVLAALAGALLAVPTAAEIPVAQGLYHAGAGLGVVGALLVTLPALSLPALIMLRRAVRPRELLLLSAAVVAVGIASGGALALLAG
ncbi:permease [Allonocardiopsis opalescens]|uniref:Permease n=1 Tax=Allonocardiopsis opalescens TaxID=1144618 RepID=A0A2T0PS55_9ACTN|nr:permease [Allonocardiopsis opalescens]PRX91727.1 hypothetical protein CLV72_1149 [Allonocardiopsis opalescens]